MHAVKVRCKTKLDCIVKFLHYLSPFSTIELYHDLAKFIQLISNQSCIFDYWFKEEFSNICVADGELRIVSK